MISVRLFTLSLLIFFVTLSGVVAAPGQLDPSFGSGGKVITPFGAGQDFGYSIAIQDDGKIVVAGYSSNGANYDFAVARYTATGELDTTFGTGGKVLTPIGTGDDYGRAVAVQADGKIVVAGGAYNGTNFDFAVVRYASTGALDPAFGNGGKVVTPINGAEQGYGMVLQADGKIVVVGYTDAGGNDDLALVRYTVTGALDATFGTNGKVVTNFGSKDDRGESVAIQSDGRIVVAGRTNSINGTNDFAVARYTPAGALDTTFDTDGKVTTAIGTGDEYAQTITVQPDGRILVTGYTTGPSNIDQALVRYTASGALDAGFGTGGKITIDFGGGQDRGYGVAVQSDGRILVAGYGTTTNFDFALLRFTSSGVLDATFGNGGKVTTPIGSIHDVGYTIALQADGRAVVAGYASNGSNYDFALARYYTSNPPSAATASATNITSTGTTLNGAINPGGAQTKAYFEYGATTLYGTTTTPQNFAAGSAVVNVSHGITGLSPGATYHYRMVAGNGGGTVFGANMSFQATPGGGESPTTAPLVTTGTVSNITSDGVTVAGVVNPKGGTTQVQVEYGLTANYGNVSAPAQNVGSGTSPVNVSLPVTGLQPLTTYHYRVIASNSLGSGRGEDLTFTTAGIPPEVKTLPAEPVASTSATLRGEVIPRTGETSVAFLYGTSPGVLDRVAPVPGAYPPGNVAQPVALALPKGTLENGTNYYYRAIATSGAGTTNAMEVLSFTTQNSAPVMNGNLTFYTNGSLTIPVSSLASDADGDKLTAIVVANEGQQFGAATVSADGTAITYKPASVLQSKAEGDVFTVTVSDGGLPTPGEASGTVRVYAFNVFKGDYVGLIKTAAGGLGGTGTIDLKVTATGQATYKLIWQGQQYSGKGQVDREGSLRLFEQKLPPSGATLDLTLSLKPDPAAQIITGALADTSTTPAGIASAELVGTATVDDVDASELPGAGVFTATIFNPDNPITAPAFAAPEGGVAAAALPRGVGFTTVSIGKGKRRPAKFVGQMPDAQKFSSGVAGLRRALLDAASGQRAPSYRIFNNSLYGRNDLGPRGLVEAEVGFDRDTDSFSSPDVNWQRGRGVGNRFPQGFQTVRPGLTGFHAVLNAIRYGRPKPGLPPDGFSSSSDFRFNALLTFRDGDLLEFSRKGRLNSAKTTIETSTALPTVTPRTIKMAVKARGGTFSGSFIHPADAGRAKPKPTKFSGVFQTIGSTSKGLGVFIGSDPATVTTSGSVEIIPNQSN